MQVEEIPQGWVRITEGDTGVTISPRGILHPKKTFHGEEDDLVLCLIAARNYINSHLSVYQKRRARLGYRI